MSETRAKLPDVTDAARRYQGQQIGAWSYLAGAGNTTINITTGLRLVGLSVIAGRTTATTVTINGGDGVPVPATRSWALNPKGNVSNPTIVFTGSPDAWVVELVAGAQVGLGG